MIGAFARMIGSRSRVLQVQEDNAVRSGNDGDYREHAASADAPPERFVDKLSDEGGDVYVAPVLEALRAAVRARLGRADPSTDAPEAGTQAQGTGSP